MGKKNIILVVFILLKFLLQFYLCNDKYDLHRDEYLHLDQAHHLAWGYLSVPPVTSWFSYIIWLLGNGIFWVHFFPSLFGALTLLIVWKTTEELKGGLFACILAATAVLFSAVMRINMLFQPNSFDVLAWTFLCFSLIKYVNTQANKWLYIAALAFSIGFLNKYNIVFLIIGLVPALALTKQRNIFINKHLYFAAILSIVLIVPNLIWQYNNNFPVLHHMKVLSETQLEKVNRGDFIKEQILFFIGSIYVLIAALIALFIHKPFQKFKFYIYAFFIILLVFTYLRAKGYYAIGIYPVYLAFGAVYIEYLFQKGRWKYLKPIAIALPILLFIPIAKVVFPLYTPTEIKKINDRNKSLGLTRWEDGKEHDLPQDFADMLEWKNMAGIVEEAYNEVKNNGNTIIWCDNYGQAGAINYYVTDKNIKAYTLSADYMDWLPDTEINNIILVQEGSDDDKERKREKELFETVSFYGEVRNPLARENGTRVYILKGAKINILQLLQKEISQAREW
ncbi:glycosyltransferase family 39 protein [Flavobacterium hauense]